MDGYENYECNEQISIFDFMKDEPLCYTCSHALPRGNFRLCMVGGDGYKHIGEKVRCKKYKRKVED